MVISCLHEELLEAEHDLEQALLSAEHKHRRIQLLQKRLIEMHDSDDRTENVRAAARTVPTFSFDETYPLHLHSQHADFACHASAPDLK